MSWVTIVWSMIAAACLTLAAVHGVVWWWRRDAWANVLFALTAVATKDKCGPFGAREVREFAARLQCGDRYSTGTGEAETDYVIEA